MPTAEESSLPVFTANCAGHWLTGNLLYGWSLPRLQRAFELYHENVKALRASTLLDVRSGVLGAETVRQLEVVQSWWDERPAFRDLFLPD